MSLLINLILSLGFAGAVGAAVHFWRTYLETSRRDGMQALAARRGWALTLTGERLGRAGTLRLVPRGGLPWLAEARPRDGPTGEPVTEYEAEAPRWAEGRLILVADSKSAGVDDSEAGQPPDSSERALLDLLGAEVAQIAATLRPVAAPAGMLAFSDSNPTLRVTLEDLSQALRDWPPVENGLRGRPVLILSPNGMRLRLRRPLNRPDQMERFLELAFELSRLIGP